MLGFTYYGQNIPTKGEMVMEGMTIFTMMMTIPTMRSKGVANVRGGPFATSSARWSGRRPTGSRRSASAPKPGFVPRLDDGTTTGPDCGGVPWLSWKTGTGRCGGEGSRLGEPTVHGRQLGEPPPAAGGIVEGVYGEERQEIFDPRPRGSRCSLLVISLDDLAASAGGASLFLLSAAANSRVCHHGGGGGFRRHHGVYCSWLRRGDNNTVVASGWWGAMRRQPR